MIPIAITGIGVVSPMGLNRDEWFKSLCTGRQALFPVQAFDPADSKSRLAVEITDFEYKDVLNAKGLHFFGRTHLLAAVASRIAFSDTGIEMEDLNPDCLGLVLAMTFGTIQSITLFYDQALACGPSAVSPMGFANTVANSPASRTAILLNARGVNATLAHGETAGLEALAFSARHLTLGLEKLILAGSAYGLCRDIHRAYGFLDRLAPINNIETELLAPLDRRANGVILGEASVVLALEPHDAAKARNARIYGLITGYAQGFNPGRHLQSAQAVDIIAHTMTQAIRNAGLRNDQITWVAASANSHPVLDSLEVHAIMRVFGFSSKVRVVALKSMTGECFDVAGPQGAAAAVLSIIHGMVPPTANLKYPRPELPKACLTVEPERMPVHHVLVNALSFNGGCSSLIISTAEQL